MPVGLVLEGGAMRGMYTAGVLDTFLEENISFDGIVGVSAGALFGMNFVSKQKGRTLRYSKKCNPDKNYMGLRPLLKEGNIVCTKYAYVDLPERIDPFDNETFETSGVPYYAVVTNMETGKPEYVRIHSVRKQMDTLRASGSMPFLSKPVPLEGKIYLDGGVSDSIPYAWMGQQGYEKVVVILTRDMEYRKEPMPYWMISLFYRKHPAFAERLRHRHEAYNGCVEELLQWEREGRALVIRPSEPITIGKMEKKPENLQKVYDLGRKDCKNSLSALREFLK